MCEIKLSPDGTHQGPAMGSLELPITKLGLQVALECKNYIEWNLSFSLSFVIQCV
jgi:hypothetical protein